MSTNSDTYTITCNINLINMETQKTIIQNQSSITNYMKTGRNAQCRCGSGLKFKKCCLRKNTPLSVKIEPDQTKGYIIPRSQKQLIQSIKKIKSARTYFRCDQDFMNQHFYPIWNTYGNQHTKNFKIVWEFISKLKVNPNYRLKTLNSNSDLIFLFRCMTEEEHNVMISKKTVCTPSWTDNYNYVTFFKNHQIQTRTTERNLIVIGLFRKEDVLFNFEGEGEHYLKKGTTVVDSEIIFDWTIKDVEKTYGNPIEKLYITHDECNNGFTEATDTLISRGVELVNWFKIDGVWYTSNGIQKKISGIQRVEEIIYDWEIKYNNLNNAA